jgi:methionyl-tRNA formyltransferase
MRMVLFGTDEFAIPSLESLIEHRQQVLLCVTQPDRPQGRGLKRLPSPVKVAAQRLRVPVEEPDTLRSFLPRLQRLQPEVGVVIAYGNLIPSSLLSLATHGMLGVHPSLLPKYRGASPIAWALLNAQTMTGVTIFRLDERLDAGEIASQREVPIAATDTAMTLSARLARLGAQALLDTLDALERHTARFHPQDERQASYAPKLTKAHGRIDWRADAAAIDRLVRAMLPWPGAYTEWHGTLLKLWVTSASERDAAMTHQPGAVCSAAPEGIVVSTGKGHVVIRELQLAGRRRMNAQEFLAGHPIQVGERLGSGM